MPLHGQVPMPAQEQSLVVDEDRPERLLPATGSEEAGTRFGHRAVPKHDQGFSTQSAGPLQRATAKIRQVPPSQRCQHPRIFGDFQQQQQLFKRGGL